MDLSSISWIFAAIVGGLALCFLAISVPIRAHAKKRDLEVLVMRMKTAARLTYPSTVSFEVITERVKTPPESANENNIEIADVGHIDHGKHGIARDRNRKMWIARLVGKNAGGDEKVLRDTVGCYCAKKADAIFELHNIVAIDLAKCKEQRKHEYDMMAQGNGEGPVEPMERV